MSLYSVDQNQSRMTFLVYARHNGVFNSTFHSHTHTFTHTHMYIYIHKQGRYSQQGHFNDQVNEVGQQLLEEVLAACFYTKGWGTYYMRHIWQLPVDHSQSLFAPSNSHCNPPPSHQPYFMLTVQRNGIERNELIGITGFLQDSRS